MEGKTFIRFLHKTAFLQWSSQRNNVVSESLVLDCSGFFGYELRINCKDNSYVLTTAYLCVIYSAT
jgi:hypothetical protein